LQSQVPDTQTPEPLEFAQPEPTRQALPHAPQFMLSVRSSTQVPPHSMPLVVVVTSLQRERHSA
jgi:hypothetical protein